MVILIHRFISLDRVELGKFKILPEKRVLKPVLLLLPSFFRREEKKRKEITSCTKKDRFEIYLEFKFVCFWRFY